MRNSVSVVVAVAAVCFVAASFGTAFADSKPIKIGQLIPMTGESAESGKY